jgi:hypothetical protein
MQAVKAIYRNGDIQLLSPLTGVDDAELLVVVLDREGDSGSLAASFRRLPSDPEEDFSALGIASFFGTDDDRAVDWEEVFDAKPR